MSIAGEGERSLHRLCADASLFLIQIRTLQQCDSAVRSAKEKHRALRERRRALILGIEHLPASPCQIYS
jgi:hypothetical protein